MGKLKFGGFVFGTMIGAGLGVLFAPKTGKEMRNSLFAGGANWNDQKDRLLEAVNAGKDSAMGRSDDLKSKIEETRERLRAQMGHTPGDEPGGESADVPGDAPAGDEPVE